MPINYTSKIQQTLNLLIQLIVSMKLMKLIPITIIALVLAATMVSATHIPQVLLNPSEWPANAEKDAYLTVKSSSGDNIVKVELIFPETSDGKPIYTLTAVSEPSGWISSTTKRYGQSNPYKITWTSNTGLSVGNSADFGFTAIAPSSGQYEWSWTTTDINDGTFTGKSTTRISMAPVSYFKIFGVPEKIPAGSALKITVKAYGEDNNVKTDYTGTVSFTSSDPKVIMPKDYTFSVSDSGAKDFFVTYKTTGDQTFTVTDWSSKITQKSIVTKVETGSPVSIAITPEDSEASPGSSVTFKTMAKDKFGNKFDVTSATKWSIDKEAGGSWKDNVYTAGSEGIWTVTASYNSLIDGTSLTIKTGAVVTPPQEVPTEVPTTPTEVPTTPTTPPVTPTQPLKEMNIETKESLTISPGSNETFIVTVNNVGTTTMSDVSLTAAGVPSDWIIIYPFKITIEAGTSRDFLVVLNVPANETESKTLSLEATSTEGITAAKNVTLNLGTAPTGLVGFSKNLLNLGIVIIAVAALVLIAWELWFRKPK